MTFSPASKARLTPRDLERFPGETLFDRVGRAVCAAGCLPRKELYEAWEMARRVRRLLRGGRVVDVAGGHGLLAHLLLILDDTSPEAVVVDPAVPPSSVRIHDALVEAWPRLAGRVSYRTGLFGGAGARVGAVVDFAGGVDGVLGGVLGGGDLGPGDLVVSCHACGALTDHVIDGAVAARARVAVLPCCHDTATCEAGALEGWIDAALAIDVLRAVRLGDRGYRVWTQEIPGTITPKNRLLIGAPTAPGEMPARTRPAAPLAD